MCPEARSGLGRDTRLGKSLHALLHLNVYVSIGYQRKKGILCDDLEGVTLIGMRKYSEFSVGVPR
jgi:hypothetical protein